jgi:hypothetical protein
MGSNALRCPVCGRGELVEIDYEPGEKTAPEPATDSREVVAFSCGHEVRGARLESADQHRLNVERRTSDETVDPVPADPEAPR